ncbi:MAG TPA: SAM-dependent chlorinase/fluorinase [Candidatus Kapabacteria bacterium]|nr:SAM-dependent chlorinase/fluorinase [Candidatus Kapabacteria bacterium]HPO64024.1 SAM-dependent chlorinase/fluorinase [Candidatus Kapabacteria bacterium]
MIALLTDFGLEDSFVASMKAVIYSINPNVKIVDITHAVSPQNIKQAAFHLNVCYKYFPKETIFVCVVDPGVGSNQEPILLKTDEYLFLAPNNGILSPIIQNNSKYISFDLSENFKALDISNTFHGRDVFAPAAANLSLDKNRYNLSKAMDSTELVVFPKPFLKQNEGGCIKTEIQHIDHFGNLITSITLKEINNIQISSVTINFKDKKYKCFFSKCYSDAEEGELIAYIGSTGFLEIAVRNGNAARKIGCKNNEIIEVGV